MACRACSASTSMLLRRGNDSHDFVEHRVIEKHQENSQVRKTRQALQMIAIPAEGRDKKDTTETSDQPESSSGFAA